MATCNRTLDPASVPLLASRDRPHIAHTRASSFLPRVPGAVPKFSSATAAAAATRAQNIAPSASKPRPLFFQREEAQQHSAPSSVSHTQPHTKLKNALNHDGPHCRFMFLKTISETISSFTQIPNVSFSLLLVYPSFYLALFHIHAQLLNGTPKSVRSAHILPL